MNYESAIQALEEDLKDVSSQIGGAPSVRQAQELATDLWAMTRVIRLLKVAQERERFVTQVFENAYCNGRTAEPCCALNAAKSSKTTTMMS